MMIMAQGNTGQTDASKAIDLVEGIEEAEDTE
jgi:hypothetical protein